MSVHRSENKSDERGRKSTNVNEKSGAKCVSDEIAETPPEIPDATLLMYEKNH